MTSGNNFTIDGALAPVDAGITFEKLTEWLAGEDLGMLEIAPLPDSPEIPTQPALQLFFVAAAELLGRSNGADRLHPDALALCSRLLGEDALEKLAKTQGLEAANG